MNRKEHLEWAKGRAIEYAKRGDYAGAFGSMVSDCNKHEELRNHPALQIGMMMLEMGMIDSPEVMVLFIEDFN